jgi:branched-chain amino acid transport system permease protein
MLQEIIFIVIRGLGSGALLSLVAMSFNIVHRSSHILNFAQGNLLILAGLLAVLFYAPDAPLWLWIAGLIGATVIMGVLVGLQGLMTLIPLNYSMERDSWLITTMAVSVIIGAVLLLTQGPFVLTAISPFPNFSMFGMSSPAPYALCIVLAILWYIGLHWFVTRRPAGLAINALSQDYDAARAAGLPVRRLQVLAFIISGVILGTAGFVAAPLMTISPDAGFRYVINGFIAAIIGGLGSNTGAIIGGPVVGIISMLATYQLGGEYESSVLFALMIVVLMLRPQGIFGNSAARRV